MSERARRFIKEYKQICRRYGIKISACGCCNSPWMVSVTEKNEVKTHIKHLVEMMPHTL